MRARLATLILAGLSLSGCAYGTGLGGLSVGASYGNPYGGYGGYGYGSPYGYGGYGAGYGHGSPYGYGGYGSPYGYGGYGSPYGYGGYGSPYGYGGYGSPFGWYNGYYYPGSGHYVYDRNRNRREMTEAQRRHWMQRIAEAAAATARNGQTAGQATTQSRSSTKLAPNWGAFNRERASQAPRTGVRSIGQIERVRPRADVRRIERVYRAPARPNGARMIGRTPADD